jgi:hypothetical protein
VLLVCRVVWGVWCGWCCVVGCCVVASVGYM